MIGAISPVVYGGKSRSKWLVAIVLYAIGAGVSAFIFGALIGWIGEGVRVFVSAKARWIILATLSFAYSLNELSILRMPRPTRRWQVPSGWRVRFHPWITSALYGSLLGPGILNYIVGATFYVLLAWAFFLGNPVQSGLVLCAFGIAQILPLLIAGWSLNTWDEARHTAECSLRYREAVHSMNGFALLFVAAAIATGLIVK